MVMEEGQFCKLMHGWMPVMAMVAVQISYGGMSILYKMAAEDGMNLPVLVAYRLIFASAVMVPLAFFIERKSRPKMTWMVLFQGFLCGLFGGSLTQNLFAKTLDLTSATFAMTIPNLIPGITFVMALCFGMEKLRLKTLPGQAKVLGTVISIGGALLTTLYKGVAINIWSTHINLLHHNKQQGGHVAQSDSSKWRFLLGAAVGFINCFIYALWLIIQAKMNERYPAYYSSTAITSTIGAIQAVIFALCMERNDWNQWKLGWNIRLLTAAYTGIVTSGGAIALIAWCGHVKGPLFVSIFSPLALLFVVIFSSLLLDETLHLGGIIGAVLIVCGLYMVLWGKSKEMKKSSETQNTNQDSTPPYI